MIKTYYSINTRHLTTTVALSGGRAPVSFRDHLLTTGDTALQAALEADSGYGDEFILRPEPKRPPETVVPETTLTPAAEVGNKQQALEYLAVQCGVELKPSTGIARIRSAAAGHGIAFPNL